MMRTLSSRERILRAMRKQETDFVPVSPRMWKFHTMYYGEESLESCFRSKSEFDYDPIYYTEPSVPNLFYAFISPVDVLPSDVKFTYKQEENSNFRIITRRFDTPAGPLSDCWKVPIRGPYDIIPLEYLIKSPYDLPRIRYLVTSPSEDSLKQFINLNKQADQEILVTPYVRSPFNDLAAVQNPLDSLLLTHDNPSFLKELLEILQQPTIADIKAHLAIGAEIIFISGFHISLSVGWSPQNYRDYFLPLIKEMVDIIHESGAIVHFYDDGKVMGILPMMIESGIDVLSTCTPPPAGDFNLYKAKSEVGDKITLMGYVDIENILHRGTPELVESTVKEAIEMGANDNAFVLSTSDGILRQTPLENLKTYFKAGRKWGKR